MNIRTAIAQDLAAIKRQRPLILNITNIVAMDFCANALLALGASPIMSLDGRELDALVTASRAVVINMGTLSETWIEIAEQTCVLAAAKKIPIIFDPVGAGATELRTTTARTFLKKFPIDIVRGNASEILSLVSDEHTAKGVDTGIDTEIAAERIRSHLRQYPNADLPVFVMSGKTDYVVTAEEVYTIHNGDHRMTSVTAMGCVATTVIAAFRGIASVGVKPASSAVRAMAVMGACGEIAAETSRGPGSLRVNFLDHLSMADSDSILKRIEVNPQGRRDRIDKIDELLSLYLITDERLPWQQTLKIVEQAILGGVTLVQLREKNSDIELITQRAFELQALLKPKGIPLIINDHISIAKAVGAAGVHLGQSDADVRTARKMLGDNSMIGLSIETEADMERMTQNKFILETCDYLSASPVFPSLTKLDTAAALGLPAVKRMRELYSVPFIAIGGITTENLKKLMETGITGVAVVSAIFGSDDPFAAAKKFKTIIDDVKQRRPQ